MEKHGPNPLGLGLTVLGNRYFAMRHGESKANVLGVAVGDPQRGVEGFGLTELGRRRVVEAASAFQGSYSPLLDETEIVSSDFRRTRETAELLARSLGNSTRVRLREGLRERFFGELEGKEHRTMAALLETEGIEALISRYGCEPAESVHYRVVRVIRDLEAEKQPKTVVLVSHADPIQLLMAAFAGLDICERERIEPLHYAEIAELSLDMPVHFKDARAE
jgi:probable phosphoglycerate mutase